MDLHNLMDSTDSPSNFGVFLNDWLPKWATRDLSVEDILHSKRSQTLREIKNIKFGIEVWPFY